MNKMLSRLNSFQLKLSGMSDLNAVCNLLVKEVQAVSSYDRIMMYEFDPGKILYLCKIILL